MSKFSFKIKDIALEDMIRIADYIAKDNIQAANDLILKFYKMFNIICEHHKIGTNIPGYHDKGVRKVIIDKHYIIFYKQIDEVIHILRVLGSYQDLCDIL